MSVTTWNPVIYLDTVSTIAPSILIWYTWYLVCNLLLVCLCTLITEMLSTFLELLLQVIYPPPPQESVIVIICLSLKLELSYIIFKSHNFQPIYSKFCEYDWVVIVTKSWKKYVYAHFSTRGVRELILKVLFFLSNEHKFRTIS